MKSKELNIVCTLVDAFTLMVVLTFPGPLTPVVVVGLVCLNIYRWA